MNAPVVPVDAVKAASRWPGYAAAALLATWYFLSMPPGLMFFDSGEFALVGSQLGLGHPPGQPLYTILLAIAARLPGLDTLFGMNALSAVCGALCAIPTHSLMTRAIVLSPGLRFGILLAVGMLAPLWEQATRIELYAPVTLAALCLLVLGAQLVDRADSTLRRWFGAGFLSGLIAGFNPIFALAAALGVGLSALPMLMRKGLACTVRVTLTAACGGAFGCFHLCYIFFVRNVDDRFIWGDLSTGEGFWSYLFGSDYQHTAHAAWSSVPEHFWAWLLWLNDQGGTLVVVLGLFGLFMGRWSRARAPLWLLPAMAGMSFTFTYEQYFPEVPDYNGYLAVALWWTAVGLAMLAARLRISLARPAIALLVLVGAFFGPLDQRRDRSENQLARTLATVWLERQPPEGILIVESDHLVFPLMYLQEVEGLRPDVVLINAGFAASTWYWEHLYRRHTHLTPISLTAPTTGARLRRFAMAHPNRLVHVEHIGLASSLGIRPCAATWGFALGPACKTARESPSEFATFMSDAWSSGAQHDPISRKVLFSLGAARAEGLWVMGEAGVAVSTLKSSFPPDIQSLLGPSPTVRVEPGQPLPVRRPVLIGSAERNLALGMYILNSIGHTESQSWFRTNQR